MSAPLSWRRRSLLGAGGGAACLGLSRAWAQQGFEQPEAEAGPPWAPVAPLQGRLDNGLRVLLLRQPGAGPAQALLQSEQGWLQDPAGREGLAALTLWALSQGAQREGEAMDSADLAFGCDALGGSLMLGCAPQSSHLALEAPAAQLEDALQLLVDMAGAPTLRHETLEHGRERALDAVRLLPADLPALGDWAARRQLWGQSLPQAGRASLQALRRGDLQAWQRQHWRPERCRLLLRADLELPAALALAQAVLGDWRGPRPGAAPAPRAAPRPSPATARYLALPGSEQLELRLQLAVPSAAPLALAQALLLQRLAGLDLGLHSQIEPLGGLTAWQLRLSLLPHTDAAPLLVLREALGALASQAPTPQELARAEVMAQAQAQRAWEADALLALAQAQPAGGVRGESATPAALAALLARWRQPHVLLLGQAQAGLALLQSAWPAAQPATMQAVIGE